MIHQVSEGVSYEFNKFKINFFNHKYLNGTPESEVNETKVVEVPPEILPAAEELKPKAKQTNDGKRSNYWRRCGIFAGLHWLQKSKCQTR